MLNITQPVAILPETAQNIIDTFAKAENCIMLAESKRGASEGARSGQPQKASKDGFIEFTVDADGVAVIHLSGTFVAKKTPCMRAYPALFDVTATSEAAQTILAAANNDSVKAILLDIDSPGGQVLGTPELAGAVLAARDKKPVCAFTAGLCCSAAYWVAAQCSMLLASPSAVVGSIGVFMAFLDSSRKLADDGYKVELFTTGDFKGAGVSGSLNDKQKARYQAEVETVFAEFKRAVAHRNIAEDDMQGQTAFGANAANANLVDGFAANLEHAKQKLLANCR